MSKDAYYGPSGSRWIMYIPEEQQPLDQEWLGIKRVTPERIYPSNEPPTQWWQVYALAAPYTLGGGVWHGIENPYTTKPTGPLAYSDLEPVYELAHILDVPVDYKDKGVSRIKYRGTDARMILGKAPYFRDAYSALHSVLHELGHWAGVKLGYSKTNKSPLSANRKVAYRRGEVCAETVALSLLPEFGVVPDNNYHLAYMSNWLERGRFRKRLLKEGTYYGGECLEYLRCLTHARWNSLKRPIKDLLETSPQYHRSPKFSKKGDITPHPLHTPLLNL